MLRADILGAGCGCAVSDEAVRGHGATVLLCQ
jgi:hypothetical protein